MIKDNGMSVKKFFPILSWGKDYRLDFFRDDVVAAIIITMMLVPQSLAYALLAGLPPQLGLYASILPLIIYAIFGASSSLSVGPFAISSIMTAAALAAVFPDGDLVNYLAGAAVLALFSGALLLLFGLLRLGLLSNFLSFPVVSGFISASALVIMASQVGHLLGVHSSGGSLLTLVSGLLTQLDYINWYTALIGVVAYLLLWLMPANINRLAIAFGCNESWATFLSKSTPIIVIILSIFLVQFFALDKQGVVIVGSIPQGLPTLQIATWIGLEWDVATWKSLLTSAVLISIIGFVSALSVAQSFAAKRRERIDPNQEAIGLGMANLASGISGAFPLSASLSRSAISFNAGAKTPAAGAFGAVGVGITAVFFTSVLYYLPVATLAAMIMLAVTSLIDLDAMRRTWRYSRQDFAAWFLTVVITLGQGVELGLISGVMLAIILHLYNSSNPHIAVLGKLPGTEHFRNVDRHEVEQSEEFVSFRVDESLYFANARFLEDKVNALVAEHACAKHFVLLCSAINKIDSTGLESLNSINQQLNTAGIKFHLSEIKGPVLDRLKQADFLDKLSGNVYLSHYQAWTDLAVNDAGVS
jgi:SulP family sulfate permease